MLPAFLLLADGIIAVLAGSGGGGKLFSLDISWPVVALMAHSRFREGLYAYQNSSIHFRRYALANDVIQAVLRYTAGLAVGKKAWIRQSNATRLDYLVGEPQPLNLITLLCYHRAAL